MANLGGVIGAGVSALMNKENQQTISNLAGKVASKLTSKSPVASPTVQKPVAQPSAATPAKIVTKSPTILGNSGLSNSINEAPPGAADYNPAIANPIPGASLQSPESVGQTFPTMEAAKKASWQDIMSSAAKALSGGVISKDGAKSAFQAIDYAGEGIKQYAQEKSEREKIIQQSSIYKAILSEEQQKANTKDRASARGLTNEQAALERFYDLDYDQQQTAYDQVKTGLDLKAEFQGMADRAKADRYHDQAVQQMMGGGLEATQFFPNSVVRKWTSSKEEEQDLILKEALIDIPGSALKGYLSGRFFGVTDVVDQEFMRLQAQNPENQKLQQKIQGVQAGLRTISQFAGGMKTWASVAPKIGAILETAPLIGTFAKAHPVLTAYGLQNMGEEMLEATIRKSTGQEYGIGDFIMGMGMGAAFQGAGDALKFFRGNKKMVQESFEDSLKAAEEIKGSTLTKQEAESVISNTPLGQGFTGGDILREQRLAFKTMRDQGLMFGSKMTSLKGGPQGAPRVNVEAPNVELSPLHAEAKKYSTPEEFYKSQGIEVLHGTGTKFDKFDDSMRGELTGAQSAKGAIWFTNDAPTAKAYSIYSAEQGPIKKAYAEAAELEKIAQKSGKDSDWKLYDEKINEAEALADYDASYSRRDGADIKEAVIKGNLMEVDAGGKSPQELSNDDNIDSWLNSKIEEAKAQGYDGVKFMNLDDAVGVYNKPATHYAIFDSANIKTKKELEGVWKEANAKPQVELPKTPELKGGKEGVEGIDYASAPPQVKEQMDLDAMRLGEPDGAAAQSMKYEDVDFSKIETAEQFEALPDHIKKQWEADVINSPEVQQAVKEAKTTLFDTEGGENIYSAVDDFGTRFVQVLNSNKKKLGKKYKDTLRTLIAGDVETFRKAIKDSNLPEIKNLAESFKTGMLDNADAYREVIVPKLEQALSAGPVKRATTRKYMTPEELVKKMTVGNYEATKDVIMKLTSSKYLSKFGDEGKVLSRLVDTTERTRSIKTGTRLEAATTAFRGLKDSEIQNVRLASEGKRSPLDLNDKELKAFETWDNMRKEFAKEAQEAGLQVKDSEGNVRDFMPMENYFPKMVKDEVLMKMILNPERKEKLLKDMVAQSNGKIKDTVEANYLLSKYTDGRAIGKYGALEKAREANLPDYLYETDIRKVLPEYIEGATKRIEEAKAFKPDFRVAKFLANKHRLKGGDDKLMMQIFTRLMGQQKFDKYLSKWSEWARNYNTLSKLGLAQVTNLGDIIKPITDTGLANTMASIYKSFTPGGFNRARKAGILQDNLQAMLENAGAGKEWTERFMKYTGFEATEKSLRAIGFNASVRRAEILAEKLIKDPNSYRIPYVKRRLGDYGLDPQEIIKTGGLTEEMRLIAGYEGVASMQPIGKQEVPFYWQSPGGKLMTQFKSFAFKQAKFIYKNVLKEAGLFLKTGGKDGNIAPLLRFLVIGQIVGEEVGNLKAAVRLRKRPAWEDGMLQRIIDNYSTIGGAGLVTDVLSNISGASFSGGLLAALAGPTIGELDTIATAIVGDVKNLVFGGKKLAPVGELAEKGETHSQILKKIVGSIPVIGNPLRNYTMPTRATYSSRIISSPDELLRLMEVDQGKDGDAGTSDSSDLDWGGGSTTESSSDLDWGVDSASTSSSSSGGGLNWD